ncbi:MAG: CBS domain-containing protein, partial [Candidatus Micrarchaeota archaeon]|nr:CBS domain-containing protein [Candidatus Micrarchaeota archaeon]
MPRISDLMERHIVGVSKNSKVCSVLKLMQSSRVSVMPVLEDGLLVGIVTRKRIEEYSEPHSTVGEVMSKPICVEEKDGYEKAVKEMLDYGISRVPVVSSKREMHCIGMVTSTDIV